MTQATAPKALILAGGKGARLRPYTAILPKPMMPVGEYPILEIILRQLKRAGVTDVILAVGYLGHIFQAFFQDGKRLGMNITYSFEEQALGTAGPIALVLDQLGEDFLVMNGDLLTSLDYRSMYESHLKSGAAATIGTYSREVKIDFGVIERGPGGDLDRYIEKPTYHFDVSMGVNVLKASAVASYLKKGESLDIPDLMMRLRSDGRKVACYSEKCAWLDIGRVDDYQLATEIFEARVAEFLPPTPDLHGKTSG